MNTHEFFAISKVINVVENNFELKNLGDQVISLMSAKRVRDDWGHSNNYISHTSYRNTTSDDYDYCMVSKLNGYKPIYNLRDILNYHLDYYLDVKKGDEEQFIRHIKYKIVPLLKRGNYSQKEECIELINEWISSINEDSTNMWLCAGLLITGVFAYDQYQTNQKLKQKIKIIDNQYLQSLKLELDKVHKLSDIVESQLNYIINTYKGVDGKIEAELKNILDFVAHRKRPESIFKLTKVIENLLKDKFVTQGKYSTPKSCPSLYNMINEALSLNWISNREAKFIDLLREPRNLEAHELAVSLNENEFYVYLFAGLEIIYSLIGIKYHC